VRIGLIIYGHLDQTSGGYLYDRKLIEFLRKRGHRVQVISLPHRNYLLNFGENLSGRLLANLAAQKFDLLLEDELNHPSLFWLNTRLKKRIAVPLVSIVHHLRSSEQQSALLKPMYRFIEKRYLRSVDAFIFNSFTTKKAVQGLLSYRKPYAVAQPAGDRLRPRNSPAQIRARARRNGPLQIIFLGSLIRRKAPHLILEAMEMLLPESVRVIFAGEQTPEPGYAYQLKVLAQQKGLEKWVHFLGHLGEHQLAKRLRQSQVLVVPSSYEGYGIAYLEGMGFGLPAVGTRAGAAGEIITHGKDGYLIPVGDAHALASHLRRLIENRGLLAKMGMAARRSYLQHPTWQMSMARIEHFLSAYNQASSITHPYRRHS
jgi:glycosyltransferase involved in cell wall biosynthesis